MSKSSIAWLGDAFAVRPRSCNETKKLSSWVKFN